MSTTKQRLQELLKKAISQPKADRVDFQALRELLEASIDLKIESECSRVSLVPSSAVSTETTSEFHAVQSDEEPISPKSTDCDESNSQRGEGTVTKTVIIQKLDLATDTLTSSISTNQDKLTTIVSTKKLLSQSSTVENIEKDVVVLQHQIEKGTDHISVKSKHIDPTENATNIATSEIFTRETIEKPTVTEKVVSPLSKIEEKLPEPSKAGNDESVEPEKEVPKKEKNSCHEEDKEVGESKSEDKSKKEKEMPVSSANIDEKSIDSGVKPEKTVIQDGEKMEVAQDFDDSTKKSEKFSKEERDLSDQLKEAETVECAGQALVADISSEILSEKENLLATKEEISSILEELAMSSATLAEDSHDKVKQPSKEGTDREEPKESISPAEKKIDEPTVEEKDDEKRKELDSAATEKASEEPIIKPKKDVAVSKSADEKGKKVKDLSASKTEKQQKISKTKSSTSTIHSSKGSNGEKSSTKAKSTTAKTKTTTTEEKGVRKSPKRSKEKKDEKPKIESKESEQKIGVESGKQELKQEQIEKHDEKATSSIGVLESVSESSKVESKEETSKQEEEIKSPVTETKVDEIKDESKVDDVKPTPSTTMEPKTKPKTVEKSMESISKSDAMKTKSNDTKESTAGEKLYDVKSAEKTKGSRTKEKSQSSKQTALDKEKSSTVGAEKAKHTKAESNVQSASKTEVKSRQAIKEKDKVTSIDGEEKEKKGAEAQILMEAATEEKAFDEEPSENEGKIDSSLAENLADISNSDKCADDQSTDKVEIDIHEEKEQEKIGKNDENVYVSTDKMDESNIEVLTDDQNIGEKLPDQREETVIPSAQVEKFETVIDVCKSVDDLFENEISASLKQRIDDNKAASAIDDTNEGFDEEIVLNEIDLSDQNFNIEDNEKVHPEKVTTKKKERKSIGSAGSTKKLTRKAKENGFQEIESRIKKITEETKKYGGLKVPYDRFKGKSAKEIKSIEKVMKSVQSSMHLNTMKVLRSSTKKGGTWLIKRDRQEKEIRREKSHKISAHPVSGSRKLKLKQIAYAMGRKCRPSFDNCTCNALNNSNRCKSRKPLICFCCCAYRKGTDGFTYHTLCQCCGPSTNF